MEDSGGNARQTQSIPELEQAIANKRSAIEVALARRDSERRLVLLSETAMQLANQRIAALDTQVHGPSGAVYVNGQALDRGTLTLSNDVLQFRGWRGTADISLRQVEAVTLGESHLSPRDGIPVLSRVWRGQPRAAGTLLLVLKNDNSTPTHQVVVADLSDAAQWCAEIDGKKGHLDQVAARRAACVSERDEMKSAAVAAATAVETAQAAMDRWKEEIGGLSSQRDAHANQQQPSGLARTAAETTDSRLPADE